MINSDLNDNETQYTMTKEKSPYIPTQSSKTDLGISKKTSNNSVKQIDSAVKETKETKQIIKQLATQSANTKDKPALKTLTIHSSNNIGQASPNNQPRAPQSTKNDSSKPKIFQNIQVNLKSSSPRSKKTGEVLKK